MVMWLCLTMGHWLWVMVLELAFVGLWSGRLERMSLLIARRSRGSCRRMDVARMAMGISWFAMWSSDERGGILEHVVCVY